LALQAARRIAPLLLRAAADRLGVVPRVAAGVVSAAQSGGMRRLRRVLSTPDAKLTP
jgi:hypothetical protein